MGSQYVIDHVVAEHNNRIRRETYMNYTGDMLKVIAETLGCKIPYRYDDMIIKPNKEPEKTGDEIVLEVIKKAGLKVQTNDINGTGGEDNA